MRRMVSGMAALAAVALMSVTLAGAAAAGGPVYVRAEVPWNFGGLFVDAGATYDILATGQIHTAKIPYYHDPGVSKSSNGPGGQAVACIADYASDLNGTCVIDGVGFGTLIGMVVNGDTGNAEAPAFVIGDAASFTAPASGWLFLGVDELTLSYFDNSGQFTVAITPR